MIWNIHNPAFISQVLVTVMLPYSQMQVTQTCLHAVQTLATEVHLVPAYGTKQDERLKYNW